MPVFPLVGSISTLLPGVILPACSAALIMLTPMRSLTLAHGSKLSSLAATVATQPAVTLFSRTSGVCPISSVTSLAIFIKGLQVLKTQLKGVWFQTSQGRGVRRLATTTTAATSAGGECGRKQRTRIDGGKCHCVSIMVAVGGGVGQKLYLPPPGPALKRRGFSRL